MTQSGRSKLAESNKRESSKKLEFDYFNYPSQTIIDRKFQNLRNYKHFNTLFVSICKAIIQSEPMEFSKNGILHIKGVVSFFQMIILLSQSYPCMLPLCHNGIEKCKTLRLYTILRCYCKKYIEIE